jgi:hypothetical protein
MTLRCKIGTVHIVNLPKSFKKEEILQYVHTLYTYENLSLHETYFIFTIFTTRIFFPPKLSAVPSPN